MKEKDFYIRVGSNIARIRKQKGMTVQKLAEECDIEKSNLIPIEKGRINTTLSTINKLAIALGVNAKEFFD